jgi:hypothetical protein
LLWHRLFGLHLAIGSDIPEFRVDAGSLSSGFNVLVASRRWFSIAGLAFVRWIASALWQSSDGNQACCGILALGVSIRLALQIILGEHMGLGSPKVRVRIVAIAAAVEFTLVGVAITKS